MRRRSIVLSLPSIILLAILFSTLGLDIYQHGGRAFSPGELSTSSHASSTMDDFASHSEFENDCSRCHQPFRTRQADLCLNCHTDIAEEIQAVSGSHGRIESVFACYECHSDHKGRDFNLLEQAMGKFDHSTAPFSLRWHQLGFDTLPMSCDACHLTTSEFEFIDNSCEECHSANEQVFMEQHLLEFGRNCNACHDGIDQMADFDHQNTKFPLDGKHIEVQCAKCHQTGEFKNVPLDCNSCHDEPEVHLNQFDPDCSSCHNTGSWNPALFEGQLFDHENATGFSLVHHKFDYAGEVLVCQECHAQPDFEVLQDICIVCHSTQATEFMQEHIALFGASCLDCHDGVDRLSDFDHATKFPLMGRHAEIECESCHSNQVFRGTPSECVQCHAEPEIHAGFFGLKCQYCHGVEAWTPAQIRTHSFPLNHGEGSDLDCQVCHIQVYQEYTCYGCHDHQPDEMIESHQELNIAPSDLANCASCHPYGEED